METGKTLDFTLKINGKYRIKKTELLVDSEPVYILIPQLIELLNAVGYNKRRNNSMIAEALILQQIHIETERYGISHETYKWVEGNVYEWLQKRFSIIKYINFEVALNRLIEDRFITRIKIDTGKEFFRINYKRFFYSQKIKQAQEERQKHIQKLKEYKAKRASGKLTKILKGKLRRLEEKLKKKKTKAVFFRLS